MLLLWGFVTAFYGGIISWLPIPGLLCAAFLGPKANATEN